MVAVCLSVWLWLTAPLTLSFWMKILLFIATRTCSGVRKILILCQDLPQVSYLTSQFVDGRFHYVSQTGQTEEYERLEQGRTTAEERQYYTSKQVM